MFVVSRICLSVVTECVLMTSEPPIVESRDLGGGDVPIFGFCRSSQVVFHHGCAFVKYTLDFKAKWTTELELCGTICRTEMLSGQSRAKKG